MRKRESFVAALRDLVGTPFKHQGRVPGVGLDCVGVGVVAALACGFDVRDVRAYTRQASGDSLLESLEKNGERISVDELQAGDCVAVWFDRGTKHAQHVAFMVETEPEIRVVHAWQDVGLVCECGLGAMSRRIVAAFRIGGLD